jgi:hypothetical protein
LQALFGQITIPASVLEELGHAGAPLEIQLSVDRTLSACGINKFRHRGPSYQTPLNAPFLRAEVGYRRPCNIVQCVWASY